MARRQRGSPVRGPLQHNAPQGMAQTHHASKDANQKKSDERHKGRNRTCPVSHLNMSGFS